MYSIKPKGEKKNMKNRRFIKNGVAFTGLEAAIVLTAFIVVAAVFAYAILGTGFFTTEKSKEVVHAGTGTATSSLELVGNVIGKNNPSKSELKNITITLQLTAGQNPIDISKGKTVISYTDKDEHVDNLHKGNDSTISWIAGDGDILLEAGEKVQIELTLTYNVTTKPKKMEKFKLEVKPPEGAIIQIEKRIRSINGIVKFY